MKRAVITGVDYYAKFLAELMNSETRDWSANAYTSSRLQTLLAINALRGADALITFGGPAPTSALIETARRNNVPIFVVWSGPDVQKAKDDLFALEVVKQEEFIHLADGPWLVDELRPLGIDAEYFPLTAVPSGGPVKPFDSQFRVLTYLPGPRRDFYGAPLVYQVAHAMPEVQFEVVGPGERDERAPENVIFSGTVRDMQDRIDASTVLLRQPEHDGKSMLVLEALARARHVVWNYNFPHVHTATRLDDIVSTLRRMQQQHAARELELNLAGRAFVLEDFAREDIARRLGQRLEAGINEWRERRHKGTHRVAISGLEIFCAEVATFGKRFAPNWETRLMRTDSRLNMLTSIVTLLSSDVWYSIGSPVTDHWVNAVARLLRKPRVIHWVGSDIAQLADDTSLRRFVTGTNVTHLAEVNWTSQQLRNLGIVTRIAPLPPRHRMGRPVPMPEKFTIMLYVPRTRSDFYGKRDFERLMNALAGKPIRYIIVGGGDVEIPPGVDAQNLGWRASLNGVYENVSTLIRFTPRDGLSLMVLEALSYGRHVLWTQRFPYTRNVASFDDIEREVLRLLDLHMRGELQPQCDAAQMIAQSYGPQKCIENIAAAWNDALEKPTGGTLAMETP